MKKKKARFSSKELQKQIDGRIKQLAQSTDEAIISDGMKAFLDNCSRFYQYSACNQDLIHWFFPDATRVAGYKKWNEFDRYVRKGEQGIPILAPCLYKRDPDDPDSGMFLGGFRVVYVYDVSQTDGEDLPPAPEWKSPARLERLEHCLTEFANFNAITIERMGLIGNAQGSSFGGKIHLAPEAGTKTLIHELAHELLHQEGGGVLVNSETKELEAEAVAYVVGSHFCLPDLASPNYLALWDADAKKILARQDRIRTCAAEIIQGVEAFED